MIGNVSILMKGLLEGLPEELVPIPSQQKDSTSGDMTPIHFLTECSRRNVWLRQLNKGRGGYKQRNKSKDLHTVFGFRPHTHSVDGMPTRNSVRTRTHVAFGERRIFSRCDRHRVTVFFDERPDRRKHDDPVLPTSVSFVLPGTSFS